MIQITDITSCLVVICPQCGAGRLVTQWGIHKCSYKECDGKVELQYNLETATKLLEIAAKELRDYRRPRPESKPVSIYLQRFPNGDIQAVPQMT